eukprot:tig00000194_g14794.t1
MHGPLDRYKEYDRHIREALECEDPTERSRRMAMVYPETVNESNGEVVRALKDISRKLDLTRRLMIAVLLLIIVNFFLFASVVYHVHSSRPDSARLEFAIRIR